MYNLIKGNEFSKVKKNKEEFYSHPKYMCGYPDSDNLSDPPEDWIKELKDSLDTA